MKYFFLFLFPFFLFSCSKDEVEDCNLLFIGDSMIANWDVERYFPSRLSENKGRDGIGIDDLVDITVFRQESIVVLLIGTNDIRPTMSEKDVAKYTEKYINAIIGIVCNKLYLISVLPTDNSEKNKRIKAFNDLIKEDVSNHKNIIYIDCYEDFVRDGLLREDLSRDGTHLNDFGYLLLADKVKERL